MKTCILKLALSALVSFAGTARAQQPVDVLRVQNPALYKLYEDGRSYVGKLEEYASRQGFRAPYERLLTAIHELLHINSAIHQGYFIDGTYYEPYLSRSAWPTLTNRDLVGYVLPSEMTNIYSLYAMNTPNNHLGNVVDELNAYSQVAPFICLHEPTSAEKQVRNIIGHLLLQEAYLRNVRLRLPDEYIKLARSKESRGAMFTITNNSWQALASCGTDPRKVAHVEVQTLFSIPQ